MDIKNFVGKYKWYLAPGYGVYDQVFKKKKEERSTFGVIGSGVYTAFVIVKLALLPGYIGKGFATGNWHPFKFDSKDKIERVENIPDGEQKRVKQKNLEKTVNYNDLLR